MFLPLASLTVPTYAPVSGLKPLMVPLFVLFETKSVLLSLPKFLGAMARPQGWFKCPPWASWRTKVPSSLKMSKKAACPAAGGGECDKHDPANIANAEGREACGQRGIGK